MNKFLGFSFVIALFSVNAFGAESYDSFQDPLFLFPKIDITHRVVLERPSYCKQIFQKYQMKSRYDVWYKLVNTAFNLPMDQIDGWTEIEDKKIEYYTAAIDMMNRPSGEFLSGKYLSMGELFNKCVRFSPLDPKDLKQSMWLYYTTDRLPLFIPYVNRAVSHINRGFWDRALRDAAIAQTLAPNHPYPFAVHGRVLAALGQYQEARTEFETAKAKVVFTVEKLLYLNEKGNMEYSAREYPTAEKEFKSILQFDGTKFFEPRFFSKVHNNLGITYRAQASFEDSQFLLKSIEEFKKGIELDPKSPVVRTNLGRSLVLLGGKENFEEARKAFNQAVELDFDDGSARLHRAMFIWTSLELFDGSTIADKVLQIGIDDAKDALETYPQPGYAALWVWALEAKHLGYSVAQQNLANFVKKLTPDDGEVIHYILRAISGESTVKTAVDFISTHSKSAAANQEKLSELYFYLALQSKAEEKPDLYRKYLQLSKDQRTLRAQECGVAALLLQKN